MADMRNAEARARDEWMLSAEGERCLSGEASGQYLKNRLESAFLAGYAAAKRDAKGESDG